MRNATDKLDHFKTSGDLTLGIWNGLSMLGRQKLGQLIHMLDDELAKLKHDRSAFRRRRIGPGWKGMRGPLDGVVNVCSRGQGKTGCFGTKGRVINVRAAT